MDIIKLDELRDFAFALGHAHGTYRRALGPSDPNREVAEELLVIRDRLHTDALDADTISLWAGRSGKRPATGSEAPENTTPVAPGVPAARPAAPIPVHHPSSGPFTS